MKGKGSRLAILLALVLTLVGAFGVTSFAHGAGTDFSSHDFPTQSTELSQFEYVYRCTGSDGAAIRFDLDGDGTSAYNGKAHALTVVQPMYKHDGGWYSVVCSKVEYSKAGKENYSENQPTDVGSYDARITLTYGDEGQLIKVGEALTIEKADLYVCWDGEDSVVYDGQEHGKTLTAVDSDGLAPGHKIVSKGYQTNVGKYDMTYDIVDSNGQSVKDNYNVRNDSGTTGDFEITKKEVGIKWTDLVQRYDGTDKLPTATVNGVADADKDKVKAAVSVPGGESKEIGTYTAEVTELTGDAARNYILSDVGTTTTFEVVGGTFVPGLSAEDYTYGEKGQVKRDKSTVPSDWKGGTIKWEYKEASASDDEYKPYNNKTVGPYIPVGNYVVKLTYGPTELYDEVSGTAEFLVLPREVTVSGITAYDKQYDGTTDATLDYTDVVFSDGLSVFSDGLEVTATGTFENEEPGSNKTVYITGLKLSGEAAANYTLAKDGQQTKTTASIYPRAVVTASDGLVYGDTDEMVELSWDPSGGIPEDYKVEYRVGETGEFSKDIPTAEGRDAGTYDVYYRVSDNSGIVDGGCVPVIIDKDEIVVLLPGVTGKQLPYRKGTAQALVDGSAQAQGKNSQEEFVIEYSLSSSTGFSANIPTEEPMGTYYVYYRVPGDKNHYDLDTTYVFSTIYDSSVIPPTPVVIDYDSEEHNLLEKEAEMSDPLKSDGVLLYGVSDSGEEEPVEYKPLESLDDLQGKDAGDYFVWYKVVSNDSPDEDLTDPAYVVAQIKKVNAAGSVKGYEGTYDGQEHVLVVQADDVIGGNLYFSLDPNVEYTTEMPTAVDAGSYTVYYFVKGDKNHNDTAVRSVIATISRKPVTVGIEDQEITYGDKFKDVENLYTVGSDGFVYEEDEDEFEDALTYVSNYEHFDPVGEYWISGELTDRYQNNSNYDVTFSDGVLTVNPYEVTVEWPDEAGRTFVYDGKAHKVRGSLHGTLDLRFIDWLNVSLAYEYAPDEDVVNVGDYTVTASLTGTGSDNYKINDGDKASTIKITARPVYVTWPSDADCTFKYNGKTQGIEATVNNVVSGEALKPVYFERSNADVDAGEYVAQVTGIEAGNEATDVNNYQFVNEYDGKSYPWTKNWRITKLTAEIKWDPAKPEFTYDGKTHNVTAEITNIQTNDLLQKDDVSLITDGVWSAKDAGTYTAVIDGLKGDDSLNYNLIGAKTSLTWKINKAALTITADDQTINYGEDFDKTKVTYKGFVGGESEKTLTSKATVSSDYFVNAKAGKYTLTPSGAKAANYDIKYVNGKLTVNPVNNVVVAMAKTKGSSKAAISWLPVTGAVSYDVYFNKCNTNGKKYSAKLVATVGGNSYTKKKLSKGTCYKFYVVAKNAGGYPIARSNTGHFVAGNSNGTYTNAKSITPSVAALNLKKGEFATLTATQKKVKSNKKLLSKHHAAPVRYMSSNPAVAVAGPNGLVAAVGSGNCVIYVQAVNGMWAPVEVNVQ